MSAIGWRPCLCGMLLLWHVSVLVAAENLGLSVQVLSEKTPINFPGKITSGVKYGQATKFVEAVLVDAGIQYQIAFIPWKRVYKQGLETPDRMIYPVARTPAREALFHWVGQITPVHYYLFKRTGYDTKGREGLAQYRDEKIGVVNQHAHHEYLLKHGFTQLQPVNGSVLNLRKLLAGRVNLFAMSSAGLNTLCMREKIDCKRLTPAVKLEGISTGLYLALSLGSDENLLKKSVQSFEKLAANGTRNEILSRRANDENEDLFLNAFTPMVNKSEL